MPTLYRPQDPADPQRDRVYAAERAVGFPSAPEFASMREARVLAARVTASRTWRLLARHTRAEGRGVELARSRGRRAHAWVPPNHWPPRVALPRHEWTRWALFHELAHCARGRLTLNHGPEFTASYVRLVRGCWDPALAERLADAFAAYDVRVAPWAAPRRRVPAPDPAALDDRRDPVMRGSAPAAIYEPAPRRVREVQVTEYVVCADRRPPLFRRGLVDQARGRCRPTRPRVTAAPVWLAA